MENNYENLNNNESLGGEETQGRLGKLKELVTKRTFELSDIGEFNGGHFIIRDDIKGRDDKGNYIEIKGNRYYQGGFRGNKEGLGYFIKRDSSNNRDILYIGHMKGKFKEGFGIQYCGSNKYVYRGNFVNDKINGRGKMEYSNGNTYDGEWLDGKKNGHGIYTWNDDGHTYEGEFNDDKFKEGKGIETQKNREIYEGDFLLDKNGNPKPFYLEISDWKKRQRSEGNTQALSDIHMEGSRTLPDGNRHKYKLTNGSITEESNDFITMYGDNKPDEDRSEERGDIKYTINYSSESLIEYKMASRHRKTIWKLEGGVFKFENKKGKILSIPKDSDFDERDAMHAANLINSVRYINANSHNNGKYRDSSKKLCATVIRYYNSGGTTAAYMSGAAGQMIPYEDDGTVLIEDVPLHFGGISAKKLAKWLNE